MNDERGARIGRTYRDSVPHWDSGPHPAPGTPNVVVVVLDDVGFAHLGCYGSPIDTPGFDALAADGLRYSNFHVTPMCSPTRACLLTGRNHHSVGMSCLSNFDNGFPGGRGSVTHRAATLAETLGHYGFRSYCVGKWHLTPGAHLTGAGPFDQWPLGRGFERFYGFLNAETDQWAPDLWRDNHRIDVPRRPGYHLTTDLVDTGISYVADHLSADPDRPFLLYLGLGACHAPHQAPADFIDRYAGRFDDGWDAIREQILDRQRELGAVPAGAELAPRNPDVCPWDDLGADERRLACRMQEVFAGFLTHADHEVSRLTRFLADSGTLENTILIVLSDNGASDEGGRFGSENEFRAFAGLPEDFEAALAAIDDLGGPNYHNHYPTGWAQAGNTPLKWYKMHTHGGGVRAPLIVHWPARITAGGAVRHQFHHVTDVMPTVLEACGVDALDEFHGVAQMPVHGTSLAYTFDEPDDGSATHQPSRKHCQYFEMLGNRAIWLDGWKAVTHHEPGADFEDDAWELYRLDSDFSEVHDVAAENPQTLQMLVDRWWTEAGRYDVLPLDDRFRERVDARGDDGIRRTFTFYPQMSAIGPAASPDLYNRSFSITAHVRAGQEELGGVLLAQGGRSGFSFFVVDRRLAFDSNLAGRHTVLLSDDEIPSEDAVDLAISFRKTGQCTGIGRLSINGQDAGGGIVTMLANRFGTNALQCGRNSPIAVSAHYQPPFAFSSRLQRVVVRLGTDKGSSGPSAFETAMTRQ